jgi:hypothetical protein
MTCITEIDEVISALTCRIVDPPLFKNPIASLKHTNSINLRHTTSDHPERTALLSEYVHTYMGRTRNQMFVRFWEIKNLILSSQVSLFYCKQKRFNNRFRMSNIEKNQD